MLESLFEVFVAHINKVITQFEMCNCNKMKQTWGYQLMCNGGDCCQRDWIPLWEAAGMGDDRCNLDDRSS